MTTEQQKADIAIIGGTGLTSMDGLTITRREMVKTPYGAPSGPIVFGELRGRHVAFLPRHGHLHSIPPHRVNYCANIWALQSVGIRKIFAVGAVGGITAECTNERVVIPDQVIDYTSGRRNSFYDGMPERVRHIDFTYPYTDSLRQNLIEGAAEAAVTVVAGGTHGITQGPRLETAAEIRRMTQDGCTIVGMTGMPEAALARELDIEYACCAVVVNIAAGINKKIITMQDLSVHVRNGMSNARAVLGKALALT